MAETKNLRELREELNLTQQDAAMLLNTSRVTYIKWEQHPDSMPLGKYNRLLNEFERLRNIQENADGVE